MPSIRSSGMAPRARSHQSIDLVERGLKGIRDVVRAALMSYRADRDDRDLRPEDIDDLKLLISPEARRKGVQLVWRCQIPHDVPVPASTVRQIILNLRPERLSGIAARRLGQCRNRRRPGSIVLVVEDAGPGHAGTAPPTC